MTASGTNADIGTLKRFVFRGMGDKLGLERGMAGGEPILSAELGDRAGTASAETGQVPCRPGVSDWATT